MVLSKFAFLLLASYDTAGMTLIVEMKVKT
jgi:hypothetical protein